MNVSYLRYPRQDRIVNVRLSLFKACKSNHCAAAILGLLEHSQDPQGFTEDELRTALVFFRPDSINIAIRHLEELGFISTYATPDQVTGKPIWLTLDIAALNAWLETYDRNGHKDEQPQFLQFPLPVKVNPVERFTGSDYGRQALQVFEFRDKRRKVFWAARGKRSTGSKPDARRIGILMDRLKEGFTVDELCLADEGNRMNPWYQGENERQTIYDGVDLIFRSAEFVERHKTYAEANGMTIDKIARLRLSGAPDKPPVDNRKVAEMLIPVALGEADPEFVARQVKVLYGSDIDLKPISDLLKSQIASRVGIYAPTHREKLLVFREYLIGIR